VSKISKSFTPVKNDSQATKVPSHLNSIIWLAGLTGRHSPGPALGLQ